MRNEIASKQTRLFVKETVHMVSLKKEQLGCHI